MEDRHHIKEQFNSGKLGTWVHKTKDGGQIPYKGTIQSRETGNIWYTRQKMEDRHHIKEQINPGKLGTLGTQDKR
jgi:hypothetical protein